MDAKLKDIKIKGPRDGLNSHWNCKNPEKANVIYLDRNTSLKVLDWLENPDGDWYLYENSNLALSREEMLDRVIDFIETIHDYKPGGWMAYRDLMCDFINTFLKKDWVSDNIAELPELRGRGLGATAYYKKKSGFVNRPGPVLEFETDCYCESEEHCGCEPEYIFL